MGPSIAKHRGRRQTPLLWLWLVLLSGWLSAFAYLAWHLRSEALSAGFASAELHVRTFEQHFSNALQVVDLAAANLDANAPDELNPEALAEKLYAIMRPLPYLRSLSVLNVRGEVVASTNARNLTVSVSTDTFYPASDSRANLLRVGVPWQGRDLVTATQFTSAQGLSALEPYLVPVIRRMVLGDKVYWLLASLNPDYFVYNSHSLLAADQGHVEWLRYDGTLLISADPGDQVRVGVIRPQLLAPLQAAEAGQVALTLPDGRAVLSAYRASSRFPALVVAHMDRAHILARWDTEMRRLLAILLPILLALMAGAWLYQRRHETLAKQREELEKANQLAASVFESSRDAIIITDPQARIVSVNRAFEQLSGYTAQDVLGQNPRLLSSGQQPHGFYAAMWRELLAQGHWQGELANRRKNGETYLVQLTINAVIGLDGGLRHYTGMMVDITQRKAAEERLQVAASVFSHASEGIMITDPTGTIIDVNQAFSQITGYTHQEVIGQNARLLNSGHQDKSFYAAMWAELANRGEWTGEVWNRRKSGEVYSELLSISSVRDDLGRVQRYVALFSDITKQKEYEARLVQIAHFDALTGLPNRILLADRLRQAMVLSQRTQRKLAVLFLDLDGFKAVNDTFGHETGDRLLIALSNRMRQTLRDGDTLARIGGDEFVGVLAGIQDPLNSIDLLERLRDAAAQPVQVDGHWLNVSASIGVAFYPQVDEVDAEQLLRQADQAMYQAKVTGKNRFHFFDAVQDRDVRIRHESLEHIVRAIDHDELVLHYQPKVNMRTGEVLGVEALVRWQHPQDGLLMPSAFLPALENHPLTLRLGNWVLEHAVRQIEAWKALGLHLPISVNVDAQQLNQASFVDDLRDLLQHHPRVQPGDLELEILETSALSDMAHVSRVIAECREIGVSFALDDFGTGYSSLNYLRHLPARTLKIDQTFVRDMLVDPEDLAILDGVIGLSVAFRRHVIAEGVESNAHGELLLRLGCDWGQGYAIARPMPADEVPKWQAVWRPDKAWRHARRLHREDLPLLFASVETRAWVEAFVAHLRGERSHPPERDPHHCQFGHWLEDEQGGRRYAGREPYAELLALHDELHSEGERLLAMAPDQVEAHVKVLYEIRERLHERLEKLESGAQWVSGG